MPAAPLLPHDTGVFVKLEIEAAQSDATIHLTTTAISEHELWSLLLWNVVRAEEKCSDRRDRERILCLIRSVNVLLKQPARTRWLFQPYGKWLKATSFDAWTASAQGTDSVGSRLNIKVSRV